MKLLQDAWSGTRSAFIPIYGRRRVGKSELIVHFMADKPGLYFVGKRAPGPAQISEFLEVAARALSEPLLAQIRPAGWKAAFEAVIERANKATEPGKFILALDEFQWIAEAAPEIASVLQELWDRQWSQSAKVMLILCGSYFGFMEREVLGKQSPLFGRRTAQILLAPFNYLEAAEFHRSYSTVDQARVYGICGGIPAYLQEFDASQSVEQNIAARILDESSALAREPEFLLREELRELAPYHAILMALAEGKSSPTQLAKTIQADARTLNYHLQALTGLGYVQRRFPLTRGKPAVRAVRYALEDPLLRFWFRFVFPRQSTLRFLGPNRAFAEIVRPELDAYLGHSFERLCREALPLIYLAEGVPPAFEVGEYWDPAVQIDILGLREDHWTDIGECKWGTVPSVAALAQEIEAKIQLYPNAEKATLGRRAFVRTLGRKAVTSTDLRVHTLDDLYALEPS